MTEIRTLVFPNFTLNIKDFGAIGEGKTLCISSFENEINIISQKLGGILIVPPGIWFAGPILLKSNVHLHLETRTIIQFSDDDNLYPKIKTSYEGLDAYRCLSPLFALNETNIEITSGGVIDGNKLFLLWSL